VKIVVYFLSLFCVVYSWVANSCSDKYTGGGEILRCSSGVFHGRCGIINERGCSVLGGWLFERGRTGLTEWHFKTVQ
jgi:hypothetical protein